MYLIFVFDSCVLGNFNEFLNLPQNENLKYQNALQNLLQPWQNIPYILYTEDELSDFADELMLPTDDDYNKNVFISAMKRALGYNNRIRQRLQKNKARQALVTNEEFISLHRILHITTLFYFRNSYKSIIMACTPTREDIFRLLLAAGEIQSNGGERILNICDKKRPLKVVVRKSRYTAK